MTSLVQVLYWLVISDIHLGKRNRTTEVLNALRWYFSPENPQYEKILLAKVIFIAGDVFDDCLSFKSQEVHAIIFWIHSFFKWASKNGIRVRVLEGTRSHDHFQSKIFETAKELSRSPVDFRYIDKIEVEDFGDFSCLYIPDNYGKGAADNYQEALECVKAAGKQQVDIGVYHGFFKFQIPAQDKHHHAHDEELHSSLVRTYINIGHDHVAKTHGRILVQGSFDRIAHGEEGKKGGILCRWQREEQLPMEQQLSWEFIENKKAKIYKTIDLTTADHQESLWHIERVLETLPVDSYVRIRCHKDHPVYKSFEAMCVQFSSWNFSKISFEDEQKRSVAEQIRSKKAPHVCLQLTKENIVAVLSDLVGNRYQLNQERLTGLRNLLSEHV